MQRLLNKGRELYFNKPQTRVYILSPKMLYAIWGRGAGKSTIVNAAWIHRRVTEMPRSAWGIQGATFAQILTRTLPNTLAGLEMLGYKENIHYILGRRPPENWQKPYYQPQDWKHVLTFWNGTMFVLMNQDRAGRTAGLNLCGILTDEARYLNKQRFDEEAVPTVRGFRRMYGRHALYESYAFVSDMPTNKGGQWLLEQEDESMSNEIQEKIINIELLINKKTTAMEGAADKYKIRLRSEINTWGEVVNQIRKDRDNWVYVSFANAIDNINVLGPDYIYTMKKVLPDFIFRTAILNERPKGIEGGFYPEYSEALEYDGYNYTYLDGLGYDFKKLAKDTCLHDADLINAPLDIALDYGHNINVMTIGQLYGNTYRVINAIYVKSDEGLLVDLVRQFISYYKPHLNRRVNYYYDHTAVARDAVRDKSYYQIVKAELEVGGWRVNLCNIGKAKEHTMKFELVNELLRGESKGVPGVKFNRNNCKYLIESIINAPAKYAGERGFKKDKRSERDENAPQEEATHFSDSFDTLMVGVFNQRIGGGGSLGKPIIV